MIKVDSLEITINNKHILKNISFNVEDSENIAIIGQNGAGKTTLLRSVAGLNDFKGSILSDGVNIKRISPEKRASLICFVPSNSNIAGDFTVKSFLELSRYPYKKPWEKLNDIDREIINKSIELTNCGEFLKREIGTLSGGEKQRVIIAGAIAQDSHVILFDEPLTFLDPVQRYKIIKLIEKIAKDQNKTVITVTHEINEALSFSSRIIALKDGRLYFDGKPENIFSSDIIEKVFKTKFVKTKHPVSGNIFFLPDGE